MNEFGKLVCAILTSPLCEQGVYVHQLLYQDGGLVEPASSRVEIELYPVN